jgi:hypothetical protein
MMITTVTRRQFLTAITQAADMDVIYQGISASAENADWIEFYSAQYVAQGDPLYVQTQLALGYTSAQMQTLFDLAVQVPA